MPAFMIAFCWVVTMQALGIDVWPVYEFGALLAGAIYSAIDINHRWESRR